MEQCQFCGKPYKTGQIFCKHCGGKLNPDSKTIANLDILQKKIEQDSLNPQLYLSFGDFYLQNNSVTLAIEQYHKALALDENNSEIHYKIGKSQNLLENHQEALASLQKAKELNKTNDEVTRELALTFFSIQDWDKAIEVSKEYLTKNEDSEILLVLAKSRKAAGHLGDAVETFEKIYATKEIKAEVLEEFAELCETQKQHQKLPTICEKLFEVKKDERSLLTLVKAYILSKSPQKAIDLINKSEASTQKGLADYFLALANLSINNHEKASQLLNSINLKKLSITENEKKLGIDILIDETDSQLKQGSLQEAIKWCSFALEIDSQNETFARKFSGIHIRAGDEFLMNNAFDSAEPHFQHALNILNPLGTDSTHASKRLAKTAAGKGEKLLTEGKASSALGAFSKAQKHDPNTDKYKELEKEARRKLSGTRRKKAIQFSFAFVAVVILGIVGWIFMHGSIEVTVIPEGSEIVVSKLENGQKSGKITPDSTFGSFMASWINRGEYLISVNSPGYELSEQNVNVGNGKTTSIEIVLQPELGSLSIQSNPSSAEVFVDDKPYGKTPIVIDSLLAIQHEIAVKKKGYLTQRFPKTIQKKITTSIEITLNVQKKYNIVEISTQFERDFTKNKTLLNSYEIFRKFVNGVEEIDTIRDIAHVIGSPYRVTMLTKLNENATSFGNIRFLDENHFLYSEAFWHDENNVRHFDKTDLHVFNLEQNTSKLLSSFNYFDFQLISSTTAGYVNDGEFYSIDVVEGTINKLSFGANLKDCGRISLSPDRTKIVFIRYDKGSTLWLYDVSNQRSHIIHSPARGAQIGYTSPLFSLNNKYICYTVSRNNANDVLYEYNIENGEKRRLYSKEKYIMESIALHHNSEELLALKVMDRDTKTYQLVVLNRNGKIRERVFQTKAIDYNFAISNDNEELFFIRSISGYRGIWRYAIGKANSAIGLAITEGKPFAASSNSQAIAFVSEHQGFPAIYLASLKPVPDKQLWQKTLSKLDELIEQGLCMKVVKDFIQVGIIQDRYQNALAYLDSNSPIRAYTSSKSNWNRFLSTIGGHHRSVRPLVDAKKVEINILYAGYQNSHGKVKAHLTSTLKGGGRYGSSTVFELQKVDGKWKIYNATEHKW